MFHGVWIGPFIQRPTVLAALDPPISSLYSGAGGHWSGSMTASGRKAGQTGHEACSMGPKKTAWCRWWWCWKGDACRRQFFGALAWPAAGKLGI